MSVPPRSESSRTSIPAPGIRRDAVNEGFSAVKRGGVARSVSVIVVDRPGGTAAAAT